MWHRKQCLQRWRYFKQNCNSRLESMVNAQKGRCRRKKVLQIPVAENTAVFLNPSTRFHVCWVFHACLLYGLLKQHSDLHLPSAPKTHLLFVAKFHEPWAKTARNNSLTKFSLWPRFAQLQRPTAAYHHQCCHGNYPFVGTFQAANLEAELEGWNRSRHKGRVCYIYVIYNYTCIYIYMVYVVHISTKKNNPFSEFASKYIVNQTSNLKGSVPCKPSKVPSRQPSPKTFPGSTPKQCWWQGAIQAPMPQILSHGSNWDVVAHDLTILRSSLLHIYDE